MVATKLSEYKDVFKKHDFTYYTELFNEEIWGDMGQDIGSIYLSVKDDAWHIHYIRTQSGEPYPLSDTVCNVVDEYEKTLSDEALFDFLAMHQKLQEFELAIRDLMQ